MKFFENLKIKQKLLTCFILFAVVTAVVGGFGIYTMNGINNQSKNMYYDNLLPSQKLANIQATLGEIRANQLLALYERNPGTLQTRLDVINAESEENNTLLKEYETNIRNEEDRALFATLTESVATYRDIRNQNIDLLKNGKYDQALAEINQVTQAREAVDQDLEALITYNTTLAEEILNQNTASFQTQSTIMIIFIMIGIALAVGLGLMVANMISKPLQRMVEAAEAIADGNLNVMIKIDGRDEVGELGLAFEKMTGHINEIMTNIDSAAEQVAAGSKQIADSSIGLSQGATEQASSIEQLTASIEEISSQTRINADNANEANELAEITKENAELGNSEMKLMLQSMEEINESSSNISKIIKVIDEIAFQTNILALNAAVEAARARQHGKGFAVVAEEVRNLAARSADAAKETTRMIEGSIKKVDDGRKIASKTADALDKIVGNVAKVSDIVGNIASASNEQAIGISQINQGIMQVSEVVQVNSATSEESASASEELSSQAELLREQAAWFQLKNIGNFNHNARENQSSDRFDPPRGNQQQSRRGKRGNQTEGKAPIPKVTRIALSDNEFGKY
ncbi:methyl-accepting chemotaxis protein [Acetobacterium woodii]|uniref:Putative methyl-accepting chemotaxis transducer protein n=1 Tax=Acetobacterium woodii (strain ATCC 29683 / DSM 1030 / JCM 2381 / KCTC 1655 / WB1) TaxID=931626 RepID=H6LG12_ACEWD|nr:methyl-accepting chemotaxis protein [Acetobacterium woodii]AFA48300.1 putative methyl-accepting chemotaxis transducer protein [Acetobacterium woodii DSM 1030]